MVDASLAKIHSIFLWHQVHSLLLKNTDSLLFHPANAQVLRVSHWWLLTEVCWSLHSATLADFLHDCHWIILLITCWWLVREIHHSRVLYFQTLLSYCEIKFPPTNQIIILHREPIVFAPFDHYVLHHLIVNCWLCLTVNGDSEAEGLLLSWSTLRKLASKNAVKKKLRSKTYKKL